MPLDDQHDGDDAEAHGQRGRIGLAEAAERLRQLRERVVLRHERDADEAVELAHDHHDGRPRHVADQQRPREVARHEPQARDARQHQQDAGHERDPGAERQVAARVALGERRDDRRREQGDRGLRPHAHLAHAAHERVAQQGADRRVQADHRVEAAQLGVGQRLRHEQRPDGQTCQGIDRQPAAVIGPEGTEPGDRGAGARARSRT